MFSKNSHKLLFDLLSLDTAEGNASNQTQALDLIAGHLPELTKEEFISDGKVTYFLFPGTNRNVDILVSGHIDVVPGVEGSFVPKQVEDKLYARGTFDMKGPLVATIDAVKQYLAKENSPASIGFLITSDEELGGFAGTGAFLKNNPDLKPKLVIVPDGGNNFSVVAEQKGVLELKLTFDGKTAHSARPWEGDDVAIRVAEVIRAINHKYPHGSAEEWATTAVVTSVDVQSISQNAVADKAIASINLRPVASENMEQLLAYIKGLDKALEVEVVFQEPALQVDPDNPYIESYASIGEEKFGHPKVIKRYPSTSDARYFSERCRNILISRPDGGGAHSPDEWISLQGLEKFSSQMYEFLLSQAKL